MSDSPAPAVPLRIRLQGEPFTVASESTVLQLIEQLGRSPDGLAVAVNLEIVRRDRFGAHRLREGDRVDIITAVGGG